jgi:hypothetical protein
VKEVKMTLQEVIQEVQTLSIEEQKQLLKLLVDMVTEPPTKQRSLLELRGLGKEIWEGMDAQEYINQLRSEWDHRP